MSDNASAFEESEQTRSQDMDTEAGGSVPTYHGRRFSSGSWHGGAFLIALGIGFLLRNAGLDIPFLRNWWALFILFPAVSSLARAWQMYQSNGQRFTGQVSGSLMGGLVLMLVSFTFLFGVSWSLIWPVFLILAGLGTLAKGIGPR